jgi:hypothetical protein
MLRASAHRHAPHLQSEPHQPSDGDEPSGELETHSSHLPWLSDSMLVLPKDLTWFHRWVGLLTFALGFVHSEFHNPFLHEHRPLTPLLSFRLLFHLLPQPGKQLGLPEDPYNPLLLCDGSRRGLFLLYDRTPEHKMGQVRALVLLFLLLTLY